MPPGQADDYIDNSPTSKWRKDPESEVSPVMQTREIIQVLDRIADLMEVRGDNPFKVRSFRNGARSLSSLGEEVAPRVEAGTLGDVPGIGKALESVITELVQLGTCQRLEELEAEVPAGLLELAAVPGLGPRKVLAIHEELGVSTLDELERAVQEGRVATLSGFGEKTQAKILEGIEYRRQVSGRFLAPLGVQAAAELRQVLESVDGLVRLEVAGSLRRRLETIKDIDIVVAARDEDAGEALIEAFVGFERVGAVTARGSTKASIRLDDGLQADLRVVTPAQFPFALHYFTGSREHNTALRKRAREEGLKLNEYGLFPEDSEESREIEDETGIFEALGLSYVEPELREDRGEVELAAKGKLPRLVEVDDLRGVVHLHTTYSDGRDTLEDMARAARELGYEYLGVTDHSQSAGYAGGLKPDAIARQHEEIDRLNEEFVPRGLRIFKGIESDIRLDGSLDYEDEILESFDFVIAAVHSGFQLTEAEQTERVVRALRSPYTTFLAHPTGRLLLRRDGYAIDQEAILAVAGEEGVVVEINANPLRLDLDWRLGPLARRHGVLTAVHPDAHQVAGYEHVWHGIGCARKAGFTRDDVVNCLPVEEFESFLGRRRR